MNAYLKSPWVLVVGGVVVLLIVKRITGFGEGIVDSIKSAVGITPSDQELQTVSDHALLPPPTYSGDFTEAKSKAIARTLYDAMALWGTDEDAIWSALKGLTDANLYCVYKDFGVKDRGTFSSEKMDLFGWFNQELGDDDKVKMRSIWSKVYVPYV